MTNQKYEPIPIPPKQLWREFRIAYLPVMTFALLIVAIGWMWSSYVQPGAIIGEVEILHANVISPLDGTVQSLQVDYLQRVTNGQVIAIVSGLDNDQIRAELAAAEADLHLMKSRMDLDKTRNASSYSQLRVTLVENKTSLDIARIRLQQSQAEFERAEKMLQNNVIARGVNVSVESPRNDFGYDVAQRDRDTIQMEISGLEKSVAEIEKTLAELERTGVVRIDPKDAAIEESIRAQREQISQLQKPQVLRSPIDGFISKISRRTGERISTGSDVVIVSGRSSDRILAWVHTPVVQKPNIGDTVEVRRIGMGQPTFEGTVVQVGSQLEEVSPMLRSPTANPERIEIGLPLLVQSERARELIPGESVQLRVIKQATSGN